MRIDSITLTAFGAFQDRELTFRPGLNVLWGPNESGKSTCHSAVVAALCGLPEPALRRPEDRAFADRYRPWSGEPWRVKASLSLANGARIFIDRPGAPAPGGGPQVAGTGGQDLGRELEWDGAPDASRWLGLNRRTFPLTAAVGQAAVLRVAMEPGLLQEDLRRAAAGAGPDMTLERALALLDVDIDTRLLDALRELEALDRELGGRLEARDAQVGLQLASEEAAERSVRLSLRLRAVEGAIARSQAFAFAERLERIRELRRRHPERPPREEVADPVEDQVRQAVAVWEARPELPELTGPTAEELRARLEGLEDEPVEGDVEPDPAVLAAREVYEFANAELDQHWAQRPAEPEPLDVPLTADELRDLARLVEGAGPEPPGAVRPRLLRRRDDDAPKHPAARARSLGLEPDPAALRGLADQLQRAERSRAEGKRWASRQKRLRQETVNAEARLRSALGSRGVDAPAGQVMQAVFRYIRDCEERGRRAARSAEREALQEQLRARDLLERRRAESAAANQHAVDGVKAAALAARVPGVGPDQLAVELRLWVERREQERAERERAREAWRELSRLLEGRTDEEIKHELDRRRRRLLTITRDVGEEAIAEVELEGDGGDQLAQLRREVEQAARDAAATLARYEGAGWVAHPAEAEEAWGEADRRLWELAAYRDALALARERLEAAGATLNADIAPAVAAVLRRWLPRISEGRYTEAWVDPRTLQVDVRGRSGEWQPAGLLSHATAELVYLLLRMALVEHLQPAGRSCPILLDDVTVQSDSQRTLALMEILHEVSAENQVILFTREEEILAWAERSLDPERDSVQRLDRAAAAV